MRPTITFTAEVIAVSPRALCVHLDGDNIKHWVARSQIQPGSQVSKLGDQGRLIVNQWLARVANLPAPKRRQGENTLPYQERPNSGSLFRNRDLGKNPKAPTMKGEALLELEDGRLVRLDIAGWSRESEKAGKWLSLNVKLKK